MERVRIALLWLALIAAVSGSLILAEKLGNMGGGPLNSAQAWFDGLMKQSIGATALRAIKIAFPMAIIAALTGFCISLRSGKATGLKIAGIIFGGLILLWGLGWSFAHYVLPGISAGFVWVYDKLTTWYGALGLIAMAFIIIFLTCKKK